MKKRQLPARKAFAARKPPRNSHSPALTTNFSISLYIFVANFSFFFPLPPVFILIPPSVWINGADIKGKLKAICSYLDQIFMS